MSVNRELCAGIAADMQSVNLSAFTIGILWYDIELNDAELNLISQYCEQYQKEQDNG
jgi:hypothetical protein